MRLGSGCGIGDTCSGTGESGGGAAAGGGITSLSGGGDWAATMLLSATEIATINSSSRGLA
jgi:hypothetical protein